MNNWYKASTSNHQGLVIEEETGRSIAVTYDAKDAELIALLPALLQFADDMERYVTAGKISTISDRKFVLMRVKEAREGIIP